MRFFTFLPPSRASIPSNVLVAPHLQTSRAPKKVSKRKTVLFSLQLLVILIQTYFDESQIRFSSFLVSLNQVFNSKHSRKGQMTCRLYYEADKKFDTNSISQLTSWDGSFNSCLLSNSPTVFLWVRYITNFFPHVAKVAAHLFYSYSEH